MTSPFDALLSAAQAAQQAGQQLQQTTDSLTAQVTSLEAENAAQAAQIQQLEAELHPTPPPAVTTWGVNVGRGQLPAMDALFGGITAVRFYHQPPAPGSHAIVRFPTAADLGADLGSRVLVYSSKAPPQDIAAGKYDADYQAWCAAAPTDRDSYLCVRHEPENDTGYTPADLKAAWARVYDIVKASGNPRIKLTPILMQWTLDPASHRNYKDWLPDAYDAIGWDVYPTSAAVIPTMIARMKSASAAEGKPWIVGETGTFGHPEIITQLGQALAAEKLPAVLYFNNGNNALTAAQAKLFAAAMNGS